MRVLQATTDNDRRGAQVFAHQLAPVLGGGAWQVRTVGLARGGPGPHLPFEILGNRRLGATTLWRLRQAIETVDAVIGYGSTTLPACVLASTGTGVPFIYRSIGDLNYWVDTSAKQMRTRHLLHRATHVVALWPSAATTIRERFGVSEARITVIPRGVDPFAFRPVSWSEQASFRKQLGIDTDGSVACIVGSLSPEKGIDLAFSAAMQVPDLHIVVAGSGPLEEELRELARRTLPGRVTFLGRIADTRSVYGASDVLLLTSWSEGVPGVVIEAGLCGRPAVATDVGGTAFIVRSGVTGYLAPIGDVGAIADSLVQALAQAQPLGQAAQRDYVKRFALETVGQSWTELLVHVASI